MTERKKNTSHEDLYDAAIYMLKSIDSQAGMEALKGRSKEYPEFLTKCLCMPREYDPGIGPAQRMLFKKGVTMDCVNGEATTMSVAECEYLSKKSLIEKEAKEELAKAQAERREKLRKEDAANWAEEIMVKYEALIARGMPEDKAFELVKITV